MMVRRLSGRPRLSAAFPFDGFGDLRRDMFRLMDALTSAEQGMPSAGVFPPLNVSHDRDNFYIRAEMPGVRAEDLDITAANRTVTVTGTRQVAEEEGVSYHRKERAEGEFSRSVTLPGDFDSGRVEAHYVNGILKIALPKPEQAKPRQIAVKTA